MFNHWIRSLSARLWVTTVVALAASLTVLAGMVIHVLDHYPEQTLGRREEMESLARVIDSIRFDDSGFPRDVELPDQEAWLFQVAPTELKYRVLDAQGHVLLASAGAEKDGPWLTGDLSADVGKIAHADVDGRRFSIATRRVLRGQSEFYVQTATSARFIDVLVSSKVKPIPATVRVIFLLQLPYSGLCCCLRSAACSSRCGTRLTRRRR